MKGQYGDVNDHHQTNLFGKLHQIHRLQHHSLSLPVQPDFHLAGRLPNRDTQNSEEADSRSPPNSNLMRTSNTCSVTAGDGASIEVVRRPRGRPPGSKNKAKPAVSVGNEPEPGSMSPYILELPDGCDVVSSVNRFCRRRNTGLCVLSGSGVVGNVTLRQPSNSSSAVTFQGRFDLLSLSATILPQPADSIIAAAAAATANGFTISLGGPQGQVIGGMVMGPLTAVGTVYLIAASFNNPSFHRLPMEEDEPVENSGTGGNSGSGEDGNHHQPPHTAAESCGMSMFSPHLGSDVIWIPTARQPPPRY